MKSKKYILRHEYKSIVEDTAKLQKETENQQQKMIVRKLIKKRKNAALSQSIQ